MYCKVNLFIVHEHLFLIFTQSIVNHMYWVAISSKTEIEKEEKWTSLTNHIVNIHDHSGNKVFRKCTHEVIEREWLKLGKVYQLLFITMDQVLS